MLMRQIGKNGYVKINISHPPLLQTLIRQAHTMVDDDGRSLQDPLGAILVGCGGLLSVEELQPALEPFYSALKDTGREIVEEGAISQGNFEKLNVPLWTYLNIDSDTALKMVNMHFKTLLGEEVEVG